jgi:hypothetical protein
MMGRVMKPRITSNTPATITMLGLHDFFVFEADVEGAGGRYSSSTPAGW